LKTLLEPIPLLAASWLAPSQERPSLIPTHIKLLKTTAPKDMKEAKEARIQGKAAAKQRKAAQKANVKSKAGVEPSKV
jgi:ribonuclease P/MRP protein subunit POP3